MPNQHGHEEFAIVTAPTPTIDENRNNIVVVLVKKHQNKKHKIDLG
jgi:hypothetical protein